MNKDKKTEGTNNTKPKKKVPVVKQTFASLCRIAKTNPLLFMETGENKQNSLGINKIKVPINVERKLNDGGTANNDQLISTSALKKSLCEQNKSNFARSNSTRHPHVYKKPAVPLKRTVSVKAPSKPLPKEKVISNVTNRKKPPPVIRRSISAEHFEKKKHGAKTQFEQKVEKKEITQSMEDVAATKSTFKTPNRISVRTEQITFRTPTTFQRKSVPFTSTPGPEVSSLQKRLNDWLKKHNKPCGSYHHLKCFGLTNASVPADKNEENKENIEHRSDIIRGSSYEDLRIDNESTRENLQTDKAYDLKSVARDALSDLNALILEGYYREQCEAWLSMIWEKYRFVEDEPQYWECRAGIEQSRGNITSAVECFQKAIVHGAKVIHIKSHDFL